MSGGGGADDAIKFQNEQIQKTYEYDAMMWHYNYNHSVPTVAQGGYLGSLGPDKGAYKNFHLQPGQRGQIHRQYDQAVTKQNHAKLNAARQKLFQTNERNRAFDYSEDRRQFDYDVQTDVRNQQTTTRDQQLLLNTAAQNDAFNREQKILQEQIDQHAFEEKQNLLDFDFDTFSLGFKKEELLNQLGLSQSQLDAESKKASADLATQQRLNASAQDRENIQLQIRENELNTAVAKNELDLNTAITKAATETKAVGQQAALTEDKLLTEEQRAKTLLGQKTGDAAFQVAEAQLKLDAKKGDVAATKQGLTEDYLVKDAANKFNRAALGIDTEQVKQRKDYQNDLIAREIENQRATAAFGAQKANLDALNRVGQASVLQAGRSQGKNIVAYLSLIGQQQAELVDSVVRAQTVGQRKQRENKVQALNDIQRAAIKGQQLDLQALENLNKLSLGLSEADRSLDLATTQTGLELGKIGKSVQDATELTDITVKDLQREISARKGLTATTLQDIQEGVTAKRSEAVLTGTDLAQRRTGEKQLTQNRISTLLAEIEGRKKQEGILQQEIADRESYARSGTDINLRSADSELQRLAKQQGLNVEIVNRMSQSARDAYGMNIQDIRQAKKQADLLANARVMPAPRMAPGQQKPQELPEISWEPIPTPVVPPAPVPGAKMSAPTLGALDYASGIGMGALAGLGTYATMSGSAFTGTAIAAAAPYAAIAIGLGTALATFF